MPLKKSRAQLDGSSKTAKMLCCCSTADAAVHLDNALPLPIAPPASSPRDGEQVIIQLDEQYDLQQFDLDLSDPKCVILASCQGAASEWNRKNTMQVFPYDRIAQVDGKPCEAQDVLDMLKRDKANPIQLILERPRKRLLYLKKPGVLGLDMTFTLVDTKPWKASVRPWISSIQEGLVAEWNANMPELSVGPHDRIISVNSKGGSPTELADILSAAEDAVELEVLHYNL